MGIRTRRQPQRLNTVQRRKSDYRVSIGVSQKPPQHSRGTDVAISPSCAKGQEFHTQNKLGYPRFTARRRGGLHQFTVEFRTLALSCVFLFDDPLKAT